MAYPPSSLSSSTIWLGGFLLTVGVSGGGTWTSSAIRESGCVIMKMIRSTSRMSIIGTTLGSDERPPRTSPLAPAISVLLLLFGCEQAAGLGLGNRSHHTDTRPPRRFHSLLHLAVLELIVRLEVQDLVFGPRLELRPELVFERAAGNWPAVKEVVAGLVDSQHNFV